MYARREDANAPLVITSDFLAIWLLLYGHYTDSLKTEDDPDLAIGKKMVGYIQQNFGNPLSLHDIASAGGVSVSKCSQVFQKCFQTSPMLYLREYRLDQAGSMLLHENIPVTDIALMTGYNDAGYFSRSFKQMTGMTPKEYRKAGRESAG
jgi:AraC-like DNA-binding protein